ncbi:MAG: polysaccharide deacetylase family protein [Deltaproteobacteria bacterium]|nr:polysaccharide deacetylase family protein [Deltaproteobacteria bacterium]
MQNQKTYRNLLLTLLSTGLMTFFIASCGDSGRSINGGTDPNSTDPNSTDPNNTDPNDTDNPVDSGFNGTDVEADSEVLAVQESINEGAVSINGELVLPSPSSAIEVEAVTDWRNGARAAYSMVHDDICDYQMTGTEEGWKEASSRELPVGWGIIVSRCTRVGYKTATAPYWDMVKEMDAAGGEVINHSITHPNILGLSQCSVCADEAACTTVCPSIMKDMEGNLLTTDITELNSYSKTALDYELITSGEEIKTATNLDMQFYVYPLDVADDNMFTILQGQGYLGSRGGDREANPEELNSWDVDTTDPLADFRILFDAYNESTTGASEYTMNGLDHQLDTYLNIAVAKGKWGLRELHSIRPTCSSDGHGWGPVTLKLYQEHLDNVVCRQDARQIWMGKNVDIIKYRRSRAHCGTPVLSGTTLTFDGASDADCVKYATPVTVSLQGPADTQITAVSSGEFINLPQGRVLVTMDPTTSVDITFGTGTTAVATAECPTMTSGFSAEDGCGDPSACQPLGACNCEKEIPTLDAYDESVPVDTENGGNTQCDSYSSSESIAVCDLSFPTGYKSLTMGSDKYCAFPDQEYPAKDGSQWGAQMSFYGAGLVAKPKACIDASAKTGVQVCIKGQIKNAFPKTRYVAQGLYDIADATITPTEVQNIAWVYLVTDYTTGPDAWNAGHCTDENCAHPFYQIALKPDGSESCVDIPWSDFEFPYWWGDANVGFVMPEVCAAGGTVPSAETCTSGEDYDPNTDEPLARWHACPAMAGKLIDVIIAAVDDIGSEPVETKGLSAKVTLY